MKTNKRLINQINVNIDLSYIRKKKKAKNYFLGPVVKQTILNEDSSNETTSELETNQPEQPTESSASNEQQTASPVPPNENENKNDERENIDSESNNSNIELKDPSACTIIFSFRLFL